MNHYNVGLTANQRSPYHFWIPPSVWKMVELPSNCHSKSTTQAIPLSLSLRLVRISTKQYQRDLRLRELKELLEAKQYPHNFIERANDKAKKITRKVVLL